MELKKKFNKNTFYFGLLNSFIKKGKKIISKKIIDDTFFYLTQQTNKSSTDILLSLLYKLSCFVEVRKVKIKRRVVNIPFPVNFQRRFFIILKSLKMAIKDDKRKIILSKKIENEINLILFNPKMSKSLKYRSLNLGQARLSRSNVHFRW